ncbi:Vacuolar iron transporter cccA [Colletotrichum sp. SAR 10_70]|nr:Vacuolar iron transporter cccA [Colletotrichum sp. SAR 10_71]KAI8171884.1 Vacuolar iron transporter cccA [Colletotrichum sp. SAR 10_65]KAI8195686.1 Vacuolar iron transporter cccA [Colletotrichum sp. SAR 10_70]KAJ5004140.1 Vacuolar iron transporter cccA [Colletotrichum sp. SAR 10_66]
MASQNLARFLSDFTLGFSDGLTVPFALTAGLSSLGRSETVIYAGLAELCAGCISMGIGGYLAARDASRETLRSGSSLEEEEEQGMLLAERRSEEDVAENEEKSAPRRVEEAEEDVRRYLQPLNLPDATVATVLEAINSQPEGSRWASKRIRSSQSSLTNDKPATEQNSSLVSPVFSGMSISLGYLCGGLMPLLPYFIAPSVGQGLRWSIAICLVALLSVGIALGVE